MSPLLPPDSKIWQTRKRDEKSQARKNGGEQEKENETKYVVCHSTQLKKINTSYREGRTNHYFLRFVVLCIS